MSQVTMLTLLLMATSEVKGHGRMIEPPARSSAFRYNFPVPVNYNDHSLNCGGFENMWNSENMGRCGVCGDPYQQLPRENEAGGKYAKGIIVQNYTEGQRIRVTIEITVPHGGYSLFKICPNNDVTKRVTQQCLDQHPLQTPRGETKILHPTNRTAPYYIHIELVLPTGLVCTQCVLQWKWIGNRNNNCNAITGECCHEVGCGRQENFYGCADISIIGMSGVATMTSPVASSVMTTNDHDSVPGGFLPIGVAPIVG